MNMVCKVDVDVKADYELVEPKALLVALKDYTCTGSDLFTMSNNNCKLCFNHKLVLEFDSFADMVANFEKELLNKISCYVKFIDNWNVSYNVKQVRGADAY